MSRTVFYCRCGARLAGASARLDHVCPRGPDSVEEIRHIVEYRRAECAHLLSFQIVDRALQRLDNGMPTLEDDAWSLHAADRVLIETMGPDEVAASPWAVAAARMIYVAIDEKEGAR